MTDEERKAAKRERKARKAARGRERDEHKAAREARKGERDERRAALEAERDAHQAAVEAERETHQATREALRERLPGEVAVLWRGDAPARRGPRPRLTLDDIADAGIAMADREGLDAVSMARVAAELGYTAMSLYRYVSSKDEVVALMLDRATGAPPATDPTAGWRPRLEALLTAQLAVIVGHPWTTTTPLLFNAVGPHRLAWMDAMLGALDGTGLTSTQKLAITGALANQAIADARASAALAAHASRSAAAGEAAGLDALLAAVVDPDAYPALAAVTATGSAERPPDVPSTALTPGMRLLLDGVAAWIAGGGEPATTPAGGA